MPRCCTQQILNLEMKRCSNTTNQRVVCMLGHHVAQNTIIEYISTFVRL